MNVMINLIILNLIKYNLKNGNLNTQGSFELIIEEEDESSLLLKLP